MLFTDLSDALFSHEDHVTLFIRALELLSYRSAAGLSPDLPEGCKTLRSRSREPSYQNLSYYYTGGKSPKVRQAGTAYGFPAIPMLSNGHGPILKPVSGSQRRAFPFTFWEVSPNVPACARRSRTTLEYAHACTRSSTSWPWGKIPCVLKCEREKAKVMCAEDVLRMC